MWLLSVRCLVFGCSRQVAIWSQKGKRATRNNDVQRGDSIQATTRSWDMIVECMLSHHQMQSKVGRPVVQVVGRRMYIAKE